jgi:hypothetical protein
VWLQDVAGGGIGIDRLQHVAAAAVRAAAAVDIRVQPRGSAPRRLTRPPRYQPVLPEDSHD